MSTPQKVHRVLTIPARAVGNAVVTYIWISEDERHWRGTSFLPKPGGKDQCPHLINEPHPQSYWEVIRNYFIKYLLPATGITPGRKQVDRFRLIDLE